MYLIICSLLVLGGCSNKESYVTIDKAFILNKDSTELNFENDKLEDVETLFGVVFEIENKSDNNWEDSFFWSDGIELTIGENKYEEYDGEYNSIIKEFYDNSGYDNSSLEKILATDSKKILTIFKINNKLNDEKIKLNVKFADIEESIEIGNENIMNINEFDSFVTEVSGLDYRDKISIKKKISYILDIYQMIKLSYNNILLELNGVNSKQGMEMLKSSKNIWDSTKNSSMSIVSNGETKYYSINNDGYSLDRIKELYPEYYEAFNEIYNAFDIAFTLDEYDGDKFNNNIQYINGISDELTSLCEAFDVSPY